jgi:hypothetical protein
MAWTVPVTQVTGVLITAAIWNAQVTNNAAYLHGDAGTIDLATGGYLHVPGGLSVGTNNRADAGTLFIDTVAAPSTPATGAKIYVDTADNKLKVKGSSGTVTILALP